MIVFNLSYICILFPAAVLCMSNEGKQYMLDIAEREILLNLRYKAYWETILQINKDNEWPESSDFKIELDAMSPKTLLSALDDRFAAIRLNVICWRCAWYFKEGANTLLKRKNSNDEYAEHCAKIGDIVSWYNEKFSAKMFYDAYGKWLELEHAPAHSAPISPPFQSIPLADRAPSKTSESEGRFAKGIDAIFGIEIKETPIYTDNGERIDIEELVRKIDGVLGKLKTMNAIFKTANLNYENVFQNLKENCEDLNEDDRPTKGLFTDFHITCNHALWKFLGADYADIRKYMESFLGRRSVHQNFDKKAEIQYEYIKKAQGFEKKYSHVPKMAWLENDFIYASLEAQNIEIPPGFTRRTWNVQRKEYGVSEFLFVFDNN